MEPSGGEKYGRSQQREDPIIFHLNPGGRETTSTCTCRNPLSICVCVLPKMAKVPAEDTRSSVTLSRMHIETDDTMALQGAQDYPSLKYHLRWWYDMRPQLSLFPFLVFPAYFRK